MDRFQIFRKDKFSWIEKSQRLKQAKNKQKTSSFVKRNKENYFLSQFGH